MSEVDYAQEWAALADENEPPVREASPSQGGKFRLYSPLADAADDFIRWAQTPHERIYTGMNELDEQMRGTAPGEMTMFLGFSHSGKTLALTKALCHNRNKRILFFQPDEPKVLTLVKLACAFHGIPAVELEKQVAADDPKAKELLRSTARENFPNLIVIDQPLITANMERGFDEACDVFSAAPELVVVDFLELIEDIEMVPAKATWLKGFGRRNDVPLWVLHQLSRSKGADGQEVGIASGAYGGETQSTHLIGVRRKKAEILAKLKALREQKQSDANDEKIADLEYQLLIHEFTVTVNLVKNKRPGGDLLPEVDYELFKLTGQLVPLNGQLPQQYRNSQPRRPAPQEWQQEKF